MKGVEAIWLGCVLLLVPASAWVFGRFAGRRNWPVLAIMIAALVLGGGFYGLFAWGQTVVSPTRAGLIGWPEIPGFLIVFAGFVALIGWAGTPVAKRGNDISKT